MRFLRCLLLGLGLSAAHGAEAAVLGPAEPLTATFVEALVAGTLEGDAGARVAIAIDEPRLPLGNQSTSPTRITLHGLRVDERSGRLQGALMGETDDGQRFSLALRGRVTPLVEVPVLNRTVDAGELITAADLDWQERAADRLPRQAVLAAADLVGHEARRRLRPERILLARDVREPLLVRRGQPVRLVFRSAGLQIAAVGIAQDDGALGALVRVVNDDSRRQVQGLVSGAGEVSVRPVVPLSR